MVKKFVIYYDDVFLRHFDPTYTHPERPERLIIALESVKKSADKYDLSLNLKNAYEGDEKLLMEVHAKDYIEYIKNESYRGFHYIDADTYVNSETYDVALRAFTTAYLASRHTSGDAHLMVLVRPPGHHVGRKGKALGAPTNGFCIFNNSAASIASLLKLYPKVLVIDFDAHHGNGTQEIFWNESRVLHIDIHERGIYPGTGDFSDLGGNKALGTKINIPIPPFSEDSLYLWVINNVIDRLMELFKPDVIVVSAGFDAYDEDPLTDLKASELTYEAFGYILNEYLETGLVKGVISILEGGYTEGLARGIPSYIKGLSGRFRDRKRIRELVGNAEKSYSEVVKRVMEIVSRYWKGF